MKTPVPAFGNDRVRLRLLEETDLETTMAWRNRDEIRRWFKNPGVVTLEGHRGWFRQYAQSDNDFIFIVESEGVAVGQVSIYAIDRAAGDAEIGRFIAAPGCEGKGHMKSAIGVLMDWAHAELGLSRVHLEVFASNARAIGLYQSCGFAVTGNADGMIKMERSLPC